MIAAIVLLIGGFILLIKGADFFVDGASSIAKKLKVPSIVIGMTVVALGTSLPEAAVSVTASLVGNNTLAISNVTGSNIFNLMVVCGFCALFTSLNVTKDTLKKEFPFSIGCALVLLVLGYIGNELNRIDGIILLLIFIGYILYEVIIAIKSQITDDEDYKILPTWKTILYVVGGAIAIMFGGDFVVDGASTIATALGLSQTLIGLTIVALGTSLPELVTSVMAARKNEVDMAVGNVIGSNVFNILFILGMAATISPIAFLFENIIDIIILVAMSIIVLFFAYSKERIDCKEGIVMLLLYIVFMIYICIR